MKKTIAALLISSLLMAPVQAFADGEVETSTQKVQITNDENQETNEIEAVEGITPDSALYFLDKLAENIKVTITFDSVEKAEVFLSIAKERLAESNAMAEKEESELSEEALKEYKEKLEEAVNTVTEALEDGEEVAEITEEIEEVTVVNGEIIEQILSMYGDEVRERVIEELEKTYVNIESANDVANLIEDEAQENVEDENDEEESLQNIIVEVIIDEDVENEEIIKKAETEKLKARQMIAIISLAQQSGESLEDVMDTFLSNDKGLGSTAMALGIAPKEALRGINDTFKEYNKEVKAIIKANGEEISLEELKEVSDAIVGETTENDVVTEEVNEDTVTNTNEENTNDENKTNSELEGLKEKVKQIITQAKDEQKDDKKLEKEIEKAEKKIEKTIQKVEKKAEKSEVESNKGNENSRGNNNGKGNKSK